MTRFSEHYGISKTQGSLEFVDIDTSTDTRVFIDPTALRLLNTPIANECASLVQSFFGHVLDLIRRGQDAEVQTLLGALGELNETRLGWSAGRAQGSGVGAELGEVLWQALSGSRAARTGVLQDLEEASLFIDGIGPDRTSDILTNIIRGPLIQFTVDMCVKYSVPMASNVTAEVWDARGLRWNRLDFSLPVADGRPILLTPRNFVRNMRQLLDPGEYYRHYVIPRMQNQHLEADSGLVRLLRSGARRPPFKKTLISLHPNVKAENINATAEAPALLERYRSNTEKNFDVISEQTLDEVTGSPPTDFDALLADVRAATPGGTDASKYHKAVEKLLTALLYPALDHPVIEREVHEGRKRIDIRYTNIARKGFFHWLHAVHNVNASLIPVECKNYATQIGNQEIDQLSGRFSVQAGVVGILCYRGYGDKALVVRRCRDTALDGRGYMIALDDADLAEMVAERKRIEDGECFTYLWRRFEELL